MIEDVDNSTGLRKNWGHWVHKYLKVAILDEL
jgi:hypothetical protein